MKPAWAPLPPAAVVRASPRARGAVEPASLSLRWLRWPASAGLASRPQRSAPVPRAAPTLPSASVQPDFAEDAQKAGPVRGAPDFAVERTAVVQRAIASAGAASSRRARPRNPQAQHPRPGTVPPHLRSAVRGERVCSRASQGCLRRGCVAVERAALPVHAGPGGGNRTAGSLRDDSCVGVCRDLPDPPFGLRRVGCVGVGTCQDLVPRAAGARHDAHAADADAARP